MLCIEPEQMSTQYKFQKLWVNFKHLKFAQSGTAGSLRYCSRLKDRVTTTSVAPKIAPPVMIADFLLLQKHPNLASWRSWAAQEVGRVWSYWSWGSDTWGWPKDSLTLDSVAIWSLSSLLCLLLAPRTPPMYTWKEKHSKLLEDYLVLTVSWTLPFLIFQLTFIIQGGFFAVPP